MRKLLWLPLCLALSACATAGKGFAPIGNCQTSSTPGSFRCVDPAGAKLPPLPWEQAGDLVCFKLTDFKVHEEACHSP